MKFKDIKFYSALLCFVAVNALADLAFRSMPNWWFVVFIDIVICTHLYLAWQFITLKYVRFPSGCKIRRPEGSFLWCSGDNKVEED